MATSSQRTNARPHTSQDCCCQWPWSQRQATADSCLHGRPSNSHRQIWLSLLQELLLLSLGPGAHKVLSVPSESLVGIRFDFKCDCTPPIAILWLLLCPWTWGYLFLVGSNILLSMVVQQLVANFGVLAGEDEHTLLYHLASTQICLHFPTGEMNTSGRCCYRIYVDY